MVRTVRSVILGVLSCWAVAGAQGATVSLSFDSAASLTIDEGDTVRVSMSSQLSLGSNYSAYDPYHCGYGGNSSRCAYVYGYGTSAGRTQSMTFYSAYQENLGSGSLTYSGMSDSQGRSSSSGFLDISYLDEGSAWVQAQVAYSYSGTSYGRQCQSSYARYSLFGGVSDAWCTQFADYSNAYSSQAWGFGQLDVVVRNVAPELMSLVADAEVVEGEEFALSALAYDPGVNDVLSYRWDLDGDGQFGDATGSQVRWTYASSGVQLAQVEVSDGDGGVVRRSLDITVANASRDLPLPGSASLAALGLALVGMGRAQRKARPRRRSCILQAVAGTPA